MNRFREGRLVRPLPGPKPTISVGSGSWGILAAVLLAIGGSLWLFISHSAQKPMCLSRQDVKFLFGADVSDSEDTAERKRYCGILNTTLDLVSSAQSPVLLWAYDRQAHRLYQG